MSARNVRERNRLREKRADPVYLHGEKVRNRVRMAVFRGTLRRKGLCVRRERPSKSYRCAPCAVINGGGTA